MIVRFDKDALLENQQNKDNRVGVEGDQDAATGKLSEVERIVGATRKQIADGGPAIGVSASNSGRGHDPIPLDDENGDASFAPTDVDGSVEDEALQMDGEVTSPTHPKKIEVDPSKQ